MGFGLDAFADTFFADLRVRGLQDQEARIRVAGSLLGYGFGFASGAMGLHPVFISLFAFVSGAVKLGIAIILYKRTYSVGLLMRPDWSAVWLMFRASATFALIEILGIVYNKTNIFFLESATGIKGVALYSATWNIVDPISTLASEQLLGWVIFPLLASLWWTDKDRMTRLVRGNAKWLMILALPIMFLLSVESELLIGLIYPAEYADAAWMQKLLVWTLLLSFENNLFFYVMMVAGGANALLLFTVIVSLLNMVFNLTLVKPLGLTGACLVIILTKLIMALLTFLYCQIRFRFFAPVDALFPLILAAASLILYVVSKPVVGLHPAVAMTIAFYFLILWRVGERFLGRFPIR
jgi:O-antigen/teichoic acid export membrane protein